jgi:hypothetical protein
MKGGLEARHYDPRFPLAVLPERRTTMASQVVAPLRGISQDLRYAARAMKRQPAFAATTVVTLTLGIAVNTTLWSFVLCLGPDQAPSTGRTTATRKRNTAPGFRGLPGAFQASSPSIRTRTESLEHRAPM